MQPAPSRRVLSGLLFGAVAIVSCILASASDQGTSPSSTIKPVISINLLMVDFVDQAADAIWTGAANPPKRACEWQEVEYRATQLATTGTLLRLGGTGSLDNTWKDAPAWGPYAERMTQLALDAASAARAKNLNRLKQVGDQLVVNCEACHRAFKPEIPTQGIATHLSHARPLSSGVKCPLS
jgi:hypothetical protein